jgi:hypothetical protein
MDDDSNLTLREARALYFAANGLGDGGYTDRWVRFQVGPIPLYFPNTSQRVAAVRFHDLHHVLTGYDTTWKGEAEIAGWEIASGCAHHLAAWVLNLGALAVGLFIAPGASFRAYVRGRQTRNLYRRELGERLLETRVGTMRRSLGLDHPAGRACAVDVASFSAWAFLAVLSSAAHVAVPVGVLAAAVKVVAALS